MIKQLLVKGAVLGTAALALAGLAAVASLMSGNLEFATDEPVAAPIDSASALAVAQEGLAAVGTGHRDLAAERDVLSRDHDGGLRDRLLGVVGPAAAPLGDDDHADERDDCEEDPDEKDQPV